MVGKEVEKKKNPTLRSADFLLARCLGRVWAVLKLSREELSWQQG